MSTSASPIPSRVAGTIGLMKVAQLRQTTIATAIGNASTPKEAPIAIMTGSKAKCKRNGKDTDHKR